MCPEPTSPFFNLHHALGIKHRHSQSKLKKKIDQSCSMPYDCATHPIRAIMRPIAPSPPCYLACLPCRASPLAGWTTRLTKRYEYEAQARPTGPARPDPASNRARCTVQCTYAIPSIHLSTGRIMSRWVGVPWRARSLLRSLLCSLPRTWPPPRKFQSRRAQAPRPCRAGTRLCL